MQPIQPPPEPELTAERIVHARRIVTEHQKGSISLVQRVMRCRYVEAAMLLEELERIGVVGPMMPTGGRKVLVAA